MYKMERYHIIRKQSRSSNNEHEHHQTEHKIFTVYNTKLHP